MNIFYVLSVIVLLCSFILYKKNNDKVCLWSSIIYSIGLLFCYNTLIVYILHVIGINGSLLIYSIINYGVSLLLILINIIKNKKIQKFSYDKKKLTVILCLGIVVFLIGSFKLRGIETISFESADSAVHYKHALTFSDSLSLLDKENSKDIVFKNFDRTMPISYINCGFLFRIFSNVTPYKVFLYYNVMFLVIGALIFSITIFDLIDKKLNKKYLHIFMISLIYTLAFPLNTFLMGFCYLSMSIIVLNILYLTIINFKNSFDKNIIFKMMVILIITFAFFYSYYQFVPAIYLALGLYYISLWKNKKINFKTLLLYGSITLVLPFIIGCYYFLVTWIMESGLKSITKLIGLWGYCYDNITPMYLFLGLSFYIIYDLYKKKKGKKKEKFSYLKINIYVISVYILLFFILYLLKVVDLYYFYKLFSVYWLCVILYFLGSIIKYKKIFYSLFLIICILNIFVYYKGDNAFSKIIIRSNIYSWNTSKFIDERVIINKYELDLIDKSNDFALECTYNNRFLAVGNIEKTMWIYVITGRIPVYEYVEGDYVALYRYNIPSLDYFDKNYLNHKCVMYFYEDRDSNIDTSGYSILYENEAGVIVKRNINN